MNDRSPGRSLSVKNKKMVVVPSLKKIPTSDHLHQNGGFKEEMVITPTHHVHFPLTARTSRISGVTGMLRKSNSKKAERVKISDSSRVKEKCNGGSDVVLERRGKEEKASKLKEKDRDKLREKVAIESTTTRVDNHSHHRDVNPSVTHKISSVRKSTNALARTFGFGRNTDEFIESKHHPPAKSTIPLGNGDITKNHSNSNGHSHHHHAPLITTNSNTSNSTHVSSYMTTSTTSSPLAAVTANNSTNCIVVKDRTIIPIPKKKCRPQSYAEPRKLRGDRPLSFAEPSPSSRHRIMVQHLHHHGGLLDRNNATCTNHQHQHQHHQHNHNIHQQPSNVSQSFVLHQNHLQHQHEQMSKNNNDNFKHHHNASSTSISFHSNFTDFSNIIQSQNFRIAELEARLSKLRLQQMNKRKSVDFAMSCVDCSKPDPIYFTVGQEQQRRVISDEVQMVVTGHHDINYSFVLPLFLAHGRRCCSYNTNNSTYYIPSENISPKKLPIINIDTIPKITLLVGTFKLHNVEKSMFVTYE